MKSLNWATKNLTETRDYAVVTDHRHEVREIVECFEADWKRVKIEQGIGDKKRGVFWDCIAFGKTGERVVDVTASARSCPPWIICADASRLLKNI